jgi:radical SAM/Cys-rich protein
MEVNAFELALANNQLPPLVRQNPVTLQLNLGKRCNQACRHCHVDAGPNRTESMNSATIDRLLAVLECSPRVGTVDITGGAPELHPEFRRLVQAVNATGRHTIDRCNLTVLSLEGHEDTPEFLAQHKVEIIASLPCYSTANVDRQRGDGVFSASIKGLRRLNNLGYGQPGSALTLNLVYNPLGPFLPPNQGELEAAYREKLDRDFGIVFNRLYTLTNMPIARFKADLSRSGSLHEYIELLRTNFNTASVDALMCKELISVSYEGKLYDCDFNQMLDLRTPDAAKSLWDIDGFGDLKGQSIATATHCLGCTAGAGSSCGGALQ